MVTKKSAKAPAKKSPVKKSKPAKPDAPATPGFGPPDWGNVMPPPVELVPTGDAKLDAALAAVIAGTADPAAAKLAAKAPDEVLIATFRGNAIQPGVPFHDDELVDKLSPAQKRQRTKMYWAAESAKNGRESLFGWFCRRLATSAAGRAHLLELAAGDHAARLRGMAAQALRDVADDALWRELGTRLDPASWIGKVDNSSSTYLMHAYVVGATGALITDPADAYMRWRPLLAPAAAKSKRGIGQASAIVLGIRDYLGDPKNPKRIERDPAPLAPFMPELVALLDHERLEHFVMFALARMPADQAVCDAIVKRIGPIGPDTYFGDPELKLLGRTTDPAHLPVLAAALGSSWMHWDSVFSGLASIGDPRGIAVIEAWMVDNDASDRRKPAKEAIAEIRRKGGAPTAEQRAEGQSLLAGGAKKKKKR